MAYALRLFRGPASRPRRSAPADASPWGGGAILFENLEARKYFHLEWTPDLASYLDAPIGEAKGQTTFELLILFLALVVWGVRYRSTGLALLGDNLSALAEAVSLKGQHGLAKINREISWRKVRLGWRYGVAHLPSEMNFLADALSRLSAPAGSDRKVFPAALSQAKAVQPPSVVDLWACK